jgi:hypothetical protein
MSFSDDFGSWVEWLFDGGSSGHVSNGDISTGVEASSSSDPGSRRCTAGNRSARLGMNASGGSRFARAGTGNTRAKCFAGLYFARRPLAFRRRSPNWRSKALHQ